MTIHRIIKPGLAFAVCALIAAGWAVPAAQATITSRPVEENIAEDGDDGIFDADSVAGDEDIADEDMADEDMTDEDMASEDMASEDSAQSAMPPMPPVAADALPPAPSAVLRPRASQMQPPQPENIRPRAALESAPPVRDTQPYVEPVGSTHPTLYLTPDKSSIVRLDRPAASIVVGNEAHMSVFIDTPRTLIIVPRAPGASYFSVLDADSRIIMQRHVIVGPSDQYVRVRRSCGTDSHCESTSVFYCPDGMCHPVTAAPASGGGARGGAAAADGNTGGGAQGGNGGPAMIDEPVAE